MFSSGGHSQQLNMSSLPEIRMSVHVEVAGWWARESAAPTTRNNGPGCTFPRKGINAMSILKEIIPYQIVDPLS